MTEQLLEMSFWQYNAWCEAYKARMSDSLSLMFQAEYMGAHWGSAAKHKKSLASVLKSIKTDESRQKSKPMDKAKIADQFRQFEELQKYGRTQNSN